MDPLTQLAVALTLSRLARNQIWSRGVVLFLVAAMAPDLDLLSAWFGAGAYLRLHRTLLHSIPDAAVLAIAIAAIGSGAGFVRKANGARQLSLFQCSSD